VGTPVSRQELEWLAQAQAGDAIAFTRLAEAYKLPVYNLCYRMLGNAADAEDAAQETFVRIYSKMHTFRPDRSLVSWVLSIAAHYCIDRLRRRRGPMISLDETPDGLEPPSRLPLPEETALLHEARDEVQELVGTLEPEYRAPVILHYWHGLTYKEIANVMGLTPQAVKTRLHRARQKLAREAQATTPVMLEVLGAG
jgi:RNA polymerase sigma-70 factor, ECF subfamily